MGNSKSTYTDNRSKTHKSLEKDTIRAQLIGASRSFIPNHIELLAIGTFEGGEFKQIPDLTVKNFCQTEKIEIEKYPKPFGVANYSLSKNGEKTEVRINSAIYEELIYPLTLDMLMIDRKIDADLYGLEDDLYVVRSIYKSPKFEVETNGRTIVHGGDDGGGGDNELRVWAYQLHRYEINKHGIIKSARELGKVY